MSDSATPRTQSLDGFLVGGHPELGDMAYTENGQEVGRVSFFYDQLRVANPPKVGVGDVYRVQVEGCAEDPIVATVVNVTKVDVVIGQRLVVVPGVAAKVPANNFGANVQITNNALGSAGI